MDIKCVLVGNVDPSLRVWISSLEDQSPTVILQIPLSLLKDKHVKRQSVIHLLLVVGDDAADKVGIGVL